ncbi:hypothetical protein I546_0685 [Mycobacterium kansasii 732]|nr:hypothetical protein I546_0685 [Mycobacterium kansasii 732]
MNLTDEPIPGHWRRVWSLARRARVLGLDLCGAGDPAVHQPSLVDQPIHAAVRSSGGAVTSRRAEAPERRPWRDRR